MPMVLQDQLVLLDSRVEEEPRAPQARLVSQDPQEGLDPLAPRAPSERPGPWDHLAKKALLVFVETTAPQADKEREVHQDLQEALETKGTPEKMDPRAPMAPQVQLEPQDREAPWVFQVREESVEWEVSQDQRVRPESRVQQEPLEIKVLLVRSVLRV